jgi:putative two-component system response regulator
MKAVPPHLLTCKILLVDDNQTNLDLLDMVLGIVGFCDVDATTDPTQVMAMQQAKSYDLILTDLRMPVMDGFAVLEALRASDERSVLPILVITAQTDSESRLRALELGATDFLLKPFDKTEVVNRVVNMLTTRWLYLKQLDVNHELEEKVAARTKALAETTSYVIRSLGRAAEFRDNETGMHVVRMSHFCERLALELGHDRQAVELLKQASTMHDVGKIGIPDHILLKPGRLDEHEFEVMRTHAAIGAEILGGSDSALLILARTIAETHHEKWDGSGYPKGLAGEAIPLEGRIVALCDVFDALTSERPYKKAWPIEEAMAHIQASAGSHFDPALVEVFSAILPDIVALRDLYKEPTNSGD